MPSLATAVLVQHLHPGAGPGPAGDHQALAAVTVYLAVAAAGLVVAPALTGVAGLRRARAWTLSLAALVLAVLVVTATRVGAAWPELGTGWHRVAIVAHVVAAATWLGGVVHLAVFVAPDRANGQLAVGLRRFGRYAVGSGVTLAGSGVVLYAVHHLDLHDLTSTAFGALVTGKAVLLLASAMIGLGHRYAVSAPALRRRPVLLRAEALVLGSALGLGSSLVAVAEPVPVVQLLGRGIATVATDAEPTSLFVIAAARGRGVLVLLSDETVAVRDRLSGHTRQLGPGTTMPVALSGGTARLTVTNGEHAVAADVPSATAVPVADRDVDSTDVTEWAAYQLGAALAPAPQGMAARSAGCRQTSVQTQGQQLGRLLLAAGVHQVRVVADGSARARQLVAGARDAGLWLAARPGRSHVVLLATSPKLAAQALRRLTVESGGPAALYLAPWLLDGRLLSTSSALRLPPITVAAISDPMSPAADRFRVALGSVAPGVAPTVAALRGYLAGAGTSVGSAGMRLYAATPIGFLPGVVDEGHSHHDQGWFANGTLVPTSAPTAPNLPAVSPRSCAAVPA